jgi:serine/threonine protein kinase
LALTTGSRLGVYEVVARIGEGGMGEVYQATDTSLKRAVAIKVLPADVAADADRLARFQREAEVLAALNHRNVAAIYGLERSGAAIALVMELVEGEDLSQRIAHGAVPLDEALAIARQIAEALEAAHGQGIVHRDLKPANVKVRPDGTVKVLDFGLAKAMDPATASSPGLSMSPAITTPAMTHAGMILGTAAYMAPEQARGKSVDKRADIWAFGLVLFEMLTGKRLFDGEEVSDTLALVLTKDPDFSSLPATTPPAIIRLLRRCLVRDRAKRLADISDARIEIDEALTTPLSEVSRDRAPAVQPSSALTRVIPWTVAALAVVFAIAALGLWAPWREVPQASPIRVRAELGTTSSLPTGAGGTVALSPDGSTLAFIARPGGVTTPNALHIRRLGQLDATIIPGTEQAAQPFFSPDGQSIAFFATRLLKKVSVNGGAVVSLGEAPNPLGGSWADDNTIVFGGIGRGLMRMSAAGGAATPLTTLAKDEPGHTWPQMLPGGRAVLYMTPSTAPGNASIVARRLPDGEAKTIVPGAAFPRYLPSGHLTYIQGGTLFAVPFDVDALAVRGEAVPVLESVAGSVIGGVPTLSIARNGTLAYLPAVAGEAARGPMMWLDRAGPLRALRPDPSAWGTPKFSPDGRRLALTISDGRQEDIWVYDWARDILTRITSDPATDSTPIWTPDGTRIIFGSNRKGATNLYWQRADGTGEAHRLTDSVEAQMPDSIHPNGRVLAFHQGNPVGGQQSVMLLPLDDDGAGGWKRGVPTTLVGGPFLKAFPTFSPDGHWLAYVTNESGRFEIYVQPFPGPGPRVQVSSGGSNRALWSPTSREIYYATGVGRQVRMMVVPYSIAGDTLIPEKPRGWSETIFSGGPPIASYGPGYDLHPDGKRFAVAPVAPEITNRPQSQLVFIFNFFEELRRKAPVR